MKLHFINVWKEGKGVGKASYRFRTMAYYSAIILIIVHHKENNLPIGAVEMITMVSFFLLPSVFLYRYITKGSKLGQVISDSTYDFFFAGCFIGVMNLSIVPSVIFGMGALTNYLSMRGVSKLYRVFLIPAGMLPFVILDNFQFHFASSNLMVYLSIGYSAMHYFINSYILYYSGKLVRMQNVEIEKQRKEILAQSEKLKVLNDSLHSANADLEIKVHSRTRELEIKNRKLEEYTFMNAHKLRAPVATILGLIHLLDLEKVNGNDDILTGLKRTSIELDNAIRGIREKLEKEDEESGPEN